MDFDGAGRAKLTSLLAARAKQVHQIMSAMRQYDEQLSAFISGSSSKEFSIEEFKVHAQEAWYETTCLTWFLSRAFKLLGEKLEQQVDDAQSRRVPIKKITYTPDGDVESFTLDHAN